MNSQQVSQQTHHMVYIKQNDVVIVHVSPFTISVLSREQAQKFGFDISKMKEYDKISINGIPNDGYELTEHYDEYVEPIIKRGPMNAHNP
ncbi:hypothetical protein [Erwinia aphidicola]|uniref:hypothetical protein n=1 Tax=Erwinia aphidicola TaxID=68334 RepID=UPI0030179FEB